MSPAVVLDTNVLLHDPRCFEKFGEVTVIIPFAVLEELDKIKSREASEVSKNARQAIRALEVYRANNNVLHNGQFIRFESQISAADMSLLNIENSPDNQIIVTALQSMDHGPTILYTRDVNVRVKARAMGVEVADYDDSGTADSVETLYSGVVEVETEDQVLDDLLIQGSLAHLYDQFNPNEFVSLKTQALRDQGAAEFAVANASTQSLDLIDPSAMPEVCGISAANTEQGLAIWALLNDDIKLVTLSGAAGTGKTLIALAAGLAQVLQKSAYKKMLVARPIAPLGKDVGYLPGTLEEKMAPWVAPIYDNLEAILGSATAHTELVEQGILAVEPLTYIRGRSIPNVYFIIDEAQNLSAHEIKTILTRAGKNTKIILTGDPEQIDHPHLDATSNGLSYAIEKFKNQAIAAHITFTQGERSELATIASKIL